MAGDRKNINLLVIAITVLVVATLTWTYIGSWGKNRAQTPAYINSIKDLPTTEVPPALPQDIVLAKDAQVVHSYTGINPQGQQQSTFIYTTTESLKTMTQAYTDYFTKNDWVSQAIKGTSAKNLPVSTTILGTKSGETVTVLLVMQATSTLVSANLLSNATSTQ